MTLPKDSHKDKIVHHLSKHIPAFQDVFDEESFYIFAFFVVVVTIIGAYFLSKRVELKDGGHID
ncbi:hypothetical protein DPMN_009167 [Dreissena polymorpha]|uniref:Uncharacterized protein n=1 Tax=Dreissena polymorpha TaxID=45954 RepID=A0A9D4N016_DREPO|nr:hypothetical protein DPMN_009167 [Dreissena polymorpha]